MVQGDKNSDRLKVVRIEVNGRIHERAVEPRMTLLEFLREEVGLTGTKRGCDKGECGLCTVLMDGKAVLSCILPVLEAEGSKVTTIEGVAGAGGLHPVQESFVRHGAIQCGFCTPAMVLNGIGLLRNNPHPTEREIKRCVSGTLCRCTGYTKIVRAIAAAAGGEKV